MNWNISGKAVEQTLIAVSKFKMMAVRAQATVAQRHSEHQHTPVVNKKRRPSVTGPSDAAAAAAVAASWFAPGELDPEIEEEMRQIRAREDRIEEGMKLLKQRLVFLKLRAVVMEVPPSPLSLPRFLSRKSESRPRRADSAPLSGSLHRSS